MEVWKIAAGSLAPGKRARMHCDCAPHRSPSLLIEHATDGALRAYCFRCAESFWVPPPHQSLSERVERAKALRNVDQVHRVPDLPMPPVVEPEKWPLYARVWLYKAGLSDNDIQNLDIYYHGATDRVVIPVVKDGDVIFWQARGFDEHRPKYISPRVDRKHIVYECESGGPWLTLTEDILSALRVHKAGYNAWSLMGTTLTDEILARIIHGGRTVSVFLDPDAPGQEAAKKICKRLDVFGVPHRNLVAERDPKLLSLDCIASLIEEA